MQHCFYTQNKVSIKTSLEHSISHSPSCRCIDTLCRAGSGLSNMKTIAVYTIIVSCTDKKSKSQVIIHQDDMNPVLMS